MANSPRVILGIDPGSVKTGFGVIAVQRDGRFVTREHGVIRTKSGDPLPERLVKIFQTLENVCANHTPDIVVVEQAFVAKHVRSALILGHARGVALLAGRLSGAEVHEYTPTQIKLGVTGSGKAPKEQVQGMMLQLLGLPTLPAEDAADALAAALCHALRKPILEL